MTAVLNKAGAKLVDGEGEGGRNHISNLHSLLDIINLLYVQCIL